MFASKQSRITFAILSFGFIIFFQNCGKSNFDLNEINEQTESLDQKTKITQKSDLGQIFDMDGDFLFEQGTGYPYGFESSIEHLKITKFDSISVNAFTGVRYYYTGDTSDQAKTLGFRDYNDERIRTAKKLFLSGIDPLSEFAKNVKIQNKKFILGFRVADSHYTDFVNIQSYPWTPQLLSERLNSDQSISDLIVGEDKINSFTDYSKSLNFDSKQVRDEIKREMLFAIDRYQNVIDGFQVDFTRYPILFKISEAKQKITIITEVLQEVKNRLQEIEINKNRPIPLIVRIAPTETANLNAGLDVVDWAKRRIIDIAIPSSVMTIQNDYDLKFKKHLEDYGVEVYGSIMGRMPPGDYGLQDINADMKVDSSQLSFGSEPSNAYIQNAITSGYKKFQVFNWQFDQTREAFLGPIWNGSNSNLKYIFSIPRMYYNCEFELFYQNDKIKLPQVLNPNHNVALQMLLNLDAKLLHNRKLTLRIGLTDDPIPNRVIVKFNDTDLGSYALNDTKASALNMVSLTGLSALGARTIVDSELCSKPYRLAASKYMYFKNLDPKLISSGENTIELLAGQKVAIISADLLVE